MRVVPEVLLVADKDKLALRIEPTMKTGTSGTRRYDDHQRVLRWVILRGCVDIVEGFSGMNIEVSCIERLDKELKREFGVINPVSVIDCEDRGAEES